MNIIKINIDIDGLVIPEHRIFKDSRGCSFESINQTEFEKKVCWATFLVING